MFHLKEYVILCERSSTSGDGCAARTEDEMSVSVPSAVPHCPDFLEFEDVLKKMRSLDDKIVYTLNTSLPTESFRGTVNASSVCKDLYSEIQQGHSDRENMIKNCIVATADTVKNLKSLKEQKPYDFDITKNLRAEQTKLRLLQTELSVEEVIKDKTTKLFMEKCRSFYKPNAL